MAKKKASNYKKGGVVGSRTVKPGTSGGGYGAISNVAKPKTNLAKKGKR